MRFSYNLYLLHCFLLKNWSYFLGGRNMFKPSYYSDYFSLITKSLMERTPISMSGATQWGRAIKCDTAVSKLTVHVHYNDEPWSRDSGIDCPDLEDRACTCSYCNHRDDNHVILLISISGYSPLMITCSILSLIK